MSEPKASWFRFPLGRSLVREPGGQRLRGRLSLVTFFGETKKVTGCRAAPGKRLRREINRASPKKRKTHAYCKNAAACPATG
ncbi:hypothetical protein GCM10027343_13200 [Noviherbaspirillum agri]